MRRQRSLQKGRHLESGDQGTGLPQVGQDTVLLMRGAKGQNTQQVRMKGISSRHWVGRST